MPAYRPNNDELPSLEATLTKKASLFDHLAWQLKLSNFRGDEEKIGMLIIGNLDAAGYLKDVTIEELAQERVFDRPIVTTIEPDAPFYEAEAYHQGYYRGNPSQPYCAAVISPKVSKLRSKFRDLLKPEENAARR